MTVYVFTHDSWAEPEMLHRYLKALESDSPEDRSLREAFEKAVRSYYRLDETGEEGRIGPIYQMLGARKTAATAAYARQLFKGPVTHVTADQALNPAPAP